MAADVRGRLRITLGQERLQREKSKGMLLGTRLVRQRTGSHRKKIFEQVFISYNNSFQYSSLGVNVFTMLTDKASQNLMLNLELHDATL